MKPSSVNLQRVASMAVRPSVAAELLCAKGMSTAPSMVPALRSLDEAVGVGVELEDQLVDLGGAAPVVLVRLETDELASPLDHLEGTAADDRRRVLERGRRRLAGILDQMCSGTMGTIMGSMLALGALQ